MSRASCAIAVLLTLLAVPVAVMAHGDAHAAVSAAPDLTPKPMLVQSFDARGNPSQPGTGAMKFVCAKPTDGRNVYNYGSAWVTYGCPIRVYDFSPEGNTLSPFGNIQLAVNPNDPTQVAFFTLHGPSASGPTNRSRTGNTHSTYTSSDMGVTWRDNWTQGCPGDGWLGESSSGAMDAHGNVTLAFHWRSDAGSLFHVYDMPPVADDQSYMEHYCGGSEWAVESAGAVSAVHVVHVPADGNSTGPGGNSTGPGSMVVTWQETTETQYLRFAQQRDGAPGGAWQANKSGGSVPGCAAISNPVAWDGKAWVACVVGPGYTARNARAGDVDLWSYDPEDGTAKQVSFTGLQTPNPRLAVTRGGYFALFTTNFVDAQKVEVPYVMGWHGRGWTGPRDLGPQLHAMLGSIDMRDVHVTAVAMVDDTKTAYIVYEEWNKVQDNPLAGGVPGVPDPANPALPRLTDYKKVIVSLDECNAPIAASELTLGQSPELVNQQDAWAHTAMFDDEYDGLQTVRMPGDEEWVFFAVDDYGVAQFGAIRGPSGAGTQVCAVLPPPPIPPVPALPQALSVAGPASAIVGVTVGTAATAMVVYLLAARRKVADAVTAKDD